MYTKHVQPALRPGLYQNLAYFILSIFFNAFGNALTVSLNLGSSLWTASAVNVTGLTGVPISVVLIAEGVLQIAVNVVMIRKIDVRRIAGNLVFMVPFSYLVDLFAAYLNMSAINSLPLAARIFLDFVGICFIALAISIYQRVNLMLHPCDDMMQIMRFKYFKGSAAVAQFVTFMPPIVITFFCWLGDHQLYAMNIGTAFALLFQGPLVGIFDKLVFPSLKHQRLDHGGVHVS